MRSRGSTGCFRFAILAAISLLSLLLTIVMAGASSTISERVTVYYFHSTVRCDTCLMIEALAEATLRAEFPNELANGTLVWRPLDVQQAENSHFVTDFGLYANELVVVREKSGEKKSWKKIPEIWELASDPERLCLRIKDMVATSLGTKE